jgi:hypothetical protein
MKHQYFGDINDYRKYGLLRALQRHTGLKLGVCWMLTEDDSRTDGKFIAYLDDPATWRAYDAELFDALRRAVPAGRHLRHVTEHGMLRDALLVESAIVDSKVLRDEYFSAARRQLASAEIVFFDPDNGLEVESCPAGRKNSSKYVMEAEIRQAYASGQSLLVYQHFIREERNRFIGRTARRLGELAEGGTVTCFRTANVGFFLVAQPKHARSLSAAAATITQTWIGQIDVVAATAEPANLGMAACAPALNQTPAIRAHG